MFHGSWNVIEHFIRVRQIMMCHRVFGIEGEYSFEIQKRLLSASCSHTLRGAPPENQELDIVRVSIERRIESSEISISFIALAALLQYPKLLVSQMRSASFPDS